MAARSRRTATSDPGDALSRSVTVVVATIGRDEAMIRFVGSVRTRYPTLAILVADQNEPTDEMRERYERHGCEVLWLPYDCGLAFARNRALERVRTPYVLLADDDFVFTGETNVEAALSVMDAAADLGFLGGSLIDARDDHDGPRLLRKWEKRFVVCDAARTLISLPIDYLPMQERVVAGHRIYECDMTSNWGLLRTRVFEDVQWDERIKINGEHEDFFLALQARTDWNVAYLPTLRCDHRQPAVPAYRALRRRQGGRTILGEKWSFTHHLELGMGLRSFEHYRQAVSLPVPHPEVYDPPLGDALAPPPGPDVSELERRIASLEAAAAATAEELRACQEAGRALRESRSWRFTAPLRRVVEWARAVAPRR